MLYVIVSNCIVVSVFGCVRTDVDIVVGATLDCGDITVVCSMSHCLCVCLSCSQSGPCRVGHRCCCRSCVLRWVRCVVTCRFGVFIATLLALIIMAVVFGGYDYAYVVMLYDIIYIDGVDCGVAVVVGSVGSVV